MKTRAQTPVKNSIPAIRASTQELFVVFALVQVLGKCVAHWAQEPPVTIPGPRFVVVWFTKKGQKADPGRPLLVTPVLQAITYLKVTAKTSKMLLAEPAPNSLPAERSLYSIEAYGEVQFSSKLADEWAHENDGLPPNP